MFLAKTVEQRDDRALPCLLLGPHHVVHVVRCRTRETVAPVCTCTASHVFDHTVDTIQEKASDIKVVQDRSGTVPVRGSKTHATTRRATFFCYELMTKRTHTKKNSEKKETALYAFARIGTGGDLLSKGSIGRPINNTVHRCAFRPPCRRELLCFLSVELQPYMHVSICVRD